MIIILFIICLRLGVSEIFSQSSKAQIFQVECRGDGAPAAKVSDAVIGFTGQQYRITILEKNGARRNFQCDSKTTILDAAEEAGLEDLPYSCRAGACAACVGKVVEGKVDQEQQAFLSEDQKSKGYCLTCVAIPTSDLVIKSHCENELSAG